MKKVLSYLVFLVLTFSSPFAFGFERTIYECKNENGGFFEAEKISPPQFGSTSRRATLGFVDSEGKAHSFIFDHFFAGSDSDGSMSLKMVYNSIRTFGLISKAFSADLEAGEIDPTTKTFPGTVKFRQFNDLGSTMTPAVRGFFSDGIFQKFDTSFDVTCKKIKRSS